MSFIGFKFFRGFHSLFRFLTFWDRSRYTVQGSPELTMQPSLDLNLQQTSCLTQPPRCRSPRCVPVFLHCEEPGTPTSFGIMWNYSDWLIKVFMSLYCLLSNHSLYWFTQSYKTNKETSNTFHQRQWLSWKALERLIDIEVAWGSLGVGGEYEQDTPLKMRPPTHTFKSLFRPMTQVGV